MGVKQLTYVQPTGRTRAEEWARQDAERKARTQIESYSMDSFVFGAATGIAVGPRSALGASLRHGEGSARDSGVSESSYDSNGASDSGYDSGSSSSDSNSGGGSE